MIATPEILVLADNPLAEQLAKPLPPNVLAARAEPFAALEELARRTYRVVLVTGPRPGFDKLLAAIRRLQPSARVYGLTTPAGEMEVRRVNGQGLEDYFIIPPSSTDWRQILSAASVTAGPTESGQTPGQAGLSPEQLSKLLDASQDLDGLSGCIKQMVADICQCDIKWGQDQPPGADWHAMLLLEGTPPRVLWGNQPIVPHSPAGQWLAILQATLPALAGNARRSGTLHRLATTDELTGAYNRRYFIHFGEQLLQRARQKRFRVTLLLYDVDDLKIYNDRYGHAAGDEILRETARLMKQITRKHDVVARIGGDEFAVLFWDAGPTRQPNSQPPQAAYALADRFRQAVNTFQFKSLGPKATGTLSISGGLATFPWDGWTIDQLLQRADQALYTGKAAGKNVIHLVGAQSAKK